MKETVSDGARKVQCGVHSKLKYRTPYKMYNTPNNGNGKQMWWSVTSCQTPQDSSTSQSYPCSDIYVASDVRVTVCIGQCFCVCLGLTDHSTS